MEKEIDEGLYSRQLYALGKEAMQQIQKKKILISGMNGLGLEIAKNVVLSGVNQVSLHDKECATVEDMSSLFYGCSLENVGKRRTDLVFLSLCELNEYVNVDTLDQEELTEAVIARYDIVVLCDARSNDDLCRINDWCRAKERIFICASVRGLFGTVFCDFGKQFLISDVSGFKPEVHEITSIDKSEDGLVNVSGDKGHGMCDESYAKFFNVEGMAELNLLEPIAVDVKDYLSVNIGDIRNYGDHVPNTGYIVEVMMPKTIQCKPFSEFLSAIPSFDELVISDYSKMKRPQQLHICFVAANCFYENHTNWPRAWNSSDAEEMLTIARKLVKDNFAGDSKLELDEGLVKQYSYICRGNFGPLNAAVGGIVAQEILKAASHQFMPIHQFFYSDFLECLPENSSELLLDQPELLKSANDQPSRYEGQIAIFGRQFQEKLGDTRIFVIGAGAIGCELLKNLAMMGVSDGGSETAGCISVTDMDHIERSNLNRQFLFRPHDIGQPKSVTASKAVLSTMNSRLRIETRTLQLCADTEASYPNKFFSNLHCVMNALDNVEARMYAASRVEFNSVPMLDSGTLGTQASQQVVLPFMTKGYRGQQNKDAAIPICTIKNFPYQIEHTIQWAKEVFTTYFTTVPKLVEMFNKSRDEFFSHIGKLTLYQKFDTVSQMLNFFQNVPVSFEDCMKWALEQWDALFSNSIQQIKYSFPQDHKTTEGLPFWAGNKRFPQHEIFDVNKTHHLDFVVYASKLRARLFCIPEANNEAIKTFSSSHQFPAFVPTNEKIATVDDDLEKFLDRNLLSQRTGELQNMDVPKSMRVTVQEFEKDDDSNCHIDFITSASNMRATNYGIPVVDRFGTKKIAGRIIPAIATSTSLVAGQVCLELVKLLQGHKNVRMYRDSYVNLASPVFTMTIPERVEKFSVLGKEFTLWDKLDVKGDISLADFLTALQEHHGLSVTCVTYKTGVLFAGFLDADQLARVMPMKVTSVIREVLSLPLAEGETAVELHVAVEDEEGDDIEPMPTVRYTF